MAYLTQPYCSNPFGLHQPGQIIYIQKAQFLCSRCRKAFVLVYGRNADAWEAYVKRIENLTVEIRRAAGRLPDHVIKACLDAMAFDVGRMKSVWFMRNEFAREDMSEKALNYRTAVSLDEAVFVEDGVTYHNVITNEDWAYDPNVAVVKVDFGMPTTGLLDVTNELLITWIRELEKALNIKEMYAFHLMTFEDLGSTAICEEIGWKSRNSVTRMKKKVAAVNESLGVTSKELDEVKAELKRKRAELLEK